MSKQSNVGDSEVYSADDQRTYSDAEKQQAKDDARFHEGQENSHKAQDSKDERSIANKLERESKREDEKDEDTPEVAALKEDPTLPARLHGNEPSKGAKIDKKIQDEEEELIAKMDAKKEQKKQNK